MSQELLLRIHRQRQGHDTGADSVPAAASNPQNTTAAAAQARPRPGAAAAATATATATATVEEGEGQRPAAGGGASSTDAHVHELAAQASKLRGMSGNVKRLLEIAAGEVQGALEDTRDSLGVAAAAAATATAPATAVGAQKQESVGPMKESVDALEEELRDSTAAARALEAEKSRLGRELGTAVGELAKVQGLLREKAAEVRLRRSGVCCYCSRRLFQVYSVQIYILFCGCVALQGLAVPCPSSVRLKLAHIFLVWAARLFKCLDASLCTKVCRNCGAAVNAIVQRHISSPLGGGRAMFRCSVLSRVVFF